MRRGKRIKTIELPYEDPQRVVYMVPVGIPVEIPQPQPKESAFRSTKTRTQEREGDSCKLIGQK